VRYITMRPQAERALCCGVTSTPSATRCAYTVAAVAAILGGIKHSPTALTPRAHACSSEHARELGGKGTDGHKAAVIGDTVGDPLKDTSGPSLNILIKLMAVESLVFAPFFSSALCGYGNGMVFKFFGSS
jgi:Inorganic H+ pyrophosphatase